MLVRSYILHSVIPEISNNMINYGSLQSLKYIPNVYYVPHLKHNLISVGKLMKHGYDVIFQDNTCYIYEKPPNSRMIAKVEKYQEYDASIDS